MIPIIGISGQANSGKSTVANYLVNKYNFVEIAFADVMKRMLYNLYPKITYEQLWGNSNQRNEPLKDYPTDQKTFDNCLECGEELELLPVINLNDYFTGEMYWNCPNHGKIQFYLTTRYLLQKLNVLREVYENTYVDYTMNIVNQLINNFPGYYSKYHDNLLQYTEEEYHNNECNGIVISDVRWPDGNEGKAIKDRGGKLLRLKRGEGLTGSYGKHISEIAQKQVPDEYFDYTIDNREYNVLQVEKCLDHYLLYLEGKYPELTKQ